MHVEILESAHGDMLDGYWFYNRQEPGLGGYFSDTLYGEMASLRLYAGIMQMELVYAGNISKRIEAVKANVESRVKRGGRSQEIS